MIAVFLVAVPVLVVRACALLASDGLGYSGRRPWEFAVIASFLIAGFMVVALQRLASQKGTTVEVLEDRLQHPHWKQPILFRDIERVAIERTEFWGKPGSALHLRLIDGSTQHIPNLLLPTSPRRFAAQLRRALGRHRTAVSR